MYKRFKPNYSLWPEQARPRRGWPLKFAVGSFMLGVACATASGFVFTSSGPASVQGPAKQANVERGPIYASAVTPAATPAPAQLETENRGSRTRAAAKTKLPIIGSQSAPPSAATDGRGGDPELAGGAPAAELAESSGSSASLMRQEGDPALEGRAPEALTEGSEPGAATEPSAKPHKKTVRKTRERTRNYAVISRQKRERPTYAAARERQGPAYSTVTETASWY